MYIVCDFVRCVFNFILNPEYTCYCLYLILKINQKQFQEHLCYYLSKYSVVALISLLIIIKAAAKLQI